MFDFSIYKIVEENRLRVLLSNEDKNNDALKVLYCSSEIAIEAYRTALINLRN